MIFKKVPQQQNFINVPDFHFFVNNFLANLWNSDIKIEKNKRFFGKVVILKFGVVVRSSFKKASKWLCVA